MVENLRDVAIQRVENEHDDFIKRTKATAAAYGTEAGPEGGLHPHRETLLRYRDGYANVASSALARKPGIGKHAGLAYDREQAALGPDLAQYLE